jgi:hypothetical protein
MSELKYFKSFETEEGEVDVSVPNVPTSLEKVSFSLPRSRKEVVVSGAGAWHNNEHVVRSPVSGTIFR